MFKLSNISNQRLNTTNIPVQNVIREALATSLIDFGIPEYGGKRTAEEQLKIFKSGASKADGVQKVSYHQSGNAVDILIYINSKPTYDAPYYYMMAHHILSTAKRLGYDDWRWGGDWDEDWDLKDQTFNDLCHFERTA